MVASPELGNGVSRDLSQAVGGASLPIHTPGPWEVDSGGSSVITTATGLSNSRTHGYGCGTDFVADLNDGEYHEYSDGAEQLANARLIAAAPDLLEALQLAEGILDDFCGVLLQGEEPDDEAGEVLVKARAAISKALGQATPTTTEPQPQILGGEQ